VGIRDFLDKNPDDSRDRYLKFRKIHLLIIIIKGWDKSIPERSKEFAIIIIYPNFYLNRFFRIYIMFKSQLILWISRDL